MRYKKRYRVETVIEPFYVRAHELTMRKELRLCCICLKNHKRCYDSRRWLNLSKNWKNFRTTQWK